MKKKQIPSEMFGERLRAARRAAGLTQEKVAEHIRVDRTTYSKYEAGRVEPSLHTAYQLAVLLQVTLDELLKPE